MQPFAAGYEVFTCKPWEDEPRPTPFDFIAEQRKILDAATQVLKELRFQEYRAFVKRMTAGTLLHEDDHKDVFPVSGGNGEVWETKPFGEQDFARLYHGEPTQNALQVVLLLCHMKEVLDTKELTLDAQTALIREACDRFKNGRPFQWGNRPIDSLRRAAAKPPVEGGVDQ